MVSSIIFQVPNQPIYFFDDWWIENGQSHGRKEDQACFSKKNREIARVSNYKWRLTTAIWKTDSVLLLYMASFPQ